MIVLLEIVDFLLGVLLWIIIGQAVLSWLIAFNVINMSNDFVRQFLQALDRLTQPLYRPIRRILPDFGALDLSPMVVILLIYILRSIIIPSAQASLAGM